MNPTLVEAETGELLQIEGQPGLQGLVYVRLVSQYLSPSNVRVKHCLLQPFDSGEKQVLELDTVTGLIQTAMFWDDSFLQVCWERMDEGLSSDSHTLQNKVSEAPK